jgi:hypothetical protein
MREHRPGMTFNGPSRKRQKLWRRCGGFPAGVVFKSFTLIRTFPFLPLLKQAQRPAWKPSG